MTSAAISETSIPCIHCGYDLRGIDEAGRCPECGFRAYWSTRAPQQLSEYPATWVTTMSRATRFLSANYALLFLFLTVANSGYLPRVIWLPSVVFVLSALLQWIGMWLLAARSGHRSEPERSVVRWLLILTPLGWAVAAAVNWFDVTSVNWVMGICMLIGGFAPTVVFIRLRTVARLIADRGLAEHSAIVGVGFLCTVAAMVGMVNFRRQIGMADVWVSRLITLVTATAMLLFLLWGALILTRCVIAFGRAARIAQKQWKADIAEEEATHA